jgi:hypothetical protein
MMLVLFLEFSHKLSSIFLKTAMNEASYNHPNTGDIFNSALSTIEDLIAQRRRCLDMPMSDPPTAWQEAARE